MASSYAGDAVVSYTAVRRASEVFGRRAGLPAVLSLFALIEAAVLYERLWYVPFGDPGAQHVARFELWPALHSAGLIEPVGGSAWRGGQHARRTVLRQWQEKLTSVSRIPSYGHISQQDLLRNTFDHALDGVIWANTHGHLADMEADFFSAQRIGDWQRFVSGVDFDQEAEDANDGDDDGRYLSWDHAAATLARAAVVQALGADYVGDALEGPLVQLGDAVAARNHAARLYARLARDFQAQVEGLIDDGFSVALPIPPIVALVLERSDGSLASLLAEIKGLRDEFAAFRASYRAYANLLENPSGMALGELVNARRELLDEVSGALGQISAGRTDSRILSEIVGATVKPSGDAADPGLDIDPSLSLSALARLGVKHLALSRIKGRAQILFDVYGKAMKIRNYHSLLGRRFGTAITREELNGYRLYARAAERLSGIRRGGPGEGAA